LDDDRKASPSLLVAAHASGRRQTEHFAANHVSRRAAELALRAAPG
jgi:hypothetical protein